MADIRFQRLDVSLRGIQNGFTKTSLSLRRSGLCAFVSASFLLSVATPTAFAASPPTKLPEGGTFVTGSGSIGTPTGNNLNVTQTGARGVINWQGFSIGSGGAVQINNGSGATLNRVTSKQLSQIDGQLTGTGAVYLINPNGVVVGPGGKVLTGNRATPQGCARVSRAAARGRSDLAVPEQSERSLMIRLENFRQTLSAPLCHLMVSADATRGHEVA